MRLSASQFFILLLLLMLCLVLIAFSGIKVQIYISLPIGIIFSLSAYSDDRTTQSCASQDTAPPGTAHRNAQPLKSRANCRRI